MSSIYTDHGLLTQFAGRAEPQYPALHVMELHAEVSRQPDVHRLSER